MDAYSHIPLTEDEITEALIEAKRKKEVLLKREELRKFELKNIELKEMNWSFGMIGAYMLNRAKEIFPPTDPFVLDGDNKSFFELLCRYFINDKVFIDEARKMFPDLPNDEPVNWSLDKGLLICGNFGSGKTWMMKLFQKNARQTYYMRSAKKIAQDYLNSGKGKDKDVDIPEEYVNLFENPLNDGSVFYQKFSGLCIDDLGAENKKNNFGNVMNVIGDLIERRYEKRFTGVFLHATTNMTSGQLKEFYGERVTSRMREIFNFIELQGEDRRK